MSWPPPDPTARAEDALVTTDAPAEADEAPPASVGWSARRRWAVFGACGALVVACLLVLVLRHSDGGEPTTSRIDAWAPYWTLDASLPELPERARQLREISPFWFTATGVDSIVVDPHAPADLTEEFLDTAKRSGARVVPSIVDGLPAGGMAALLADPASRARHVDALAEFAASGDYAGLDIDYEQFAFADDRSTWSTTRPSWVAFVRELADRLHRDGRTLTVSVPPIYDAGRTEDSGYWVYDYAAIAPLVDRIRIMAYDYSTDEPGPIAPLDWVQRAIDGAKEATGDPSKLVLGVPVYGYNWVVSTTGTCPTGEADGRTGVTARSAADLAARRAAVPVYDRVTGELSFTYELELADGTTSCTQRRVVQYVDARGAAERSRLADEAGLDGVAIWALGNEPPDLWPGLAPSTVP
jgi:spore germination protein YaaH